MTPASSAKVARAQRAGRHCEVPYCLRPRQKWGKFCEAHDGAAERTGDPLGRTVLAGEVRPYTERARAYLEKNAGHPAIAEGAAWAGRLLLAGVAEHGRLPPRTTPHRRLSAGLARLRLAGVTPLEVLATLVGMTAYREDRPDAFVSDRHWRHQLANRTLRLAPAPFRQSWSNGRPLRRHYDRITVGVRELLSERLTAALGAFALRAARLLLKHHWSGGKDVPDKARLAAPLPDPTT